VPKQIPHKNLLLLIVFLIVSWASNAQISILKDGSGLCPNGRIKLSFADNVPNIVVYKWEILRNVSAGWSSLNDSTRASISTDEVGDYRLTIKDNLGNKMASNIITVSRLAAPAKPIITKTPDVLQICQGDSIKLSTQVQMGALFYYWIFNGGNSAIANSTQIYVKKNGFYKVSVGDGVCSTLSDSVRIDYKSVQEVKIDSLPPFCNVNAPSVNLIASPAGGKFTGKGITDATKGTFSPSVAGLGKHTISYSVSAGGGSCGDITETRVFTVATPPATITTNTGRTQFCVGDIASLTAPAGMKKYEWFLNGTPVGNNSKLDVGAGGDFKVKVTDGEPCSNTSPEVKIEFFSPSNVKIDPIASGCGLEFPAVPLKASPSGGAFTIDGAFATVFDYKKLGFGKHKVEYTINGVLPCLQGSDSQVVEIQDFPKPNLGPDIFLGKGNGVTLKGFIDPTMTYSWSPAEGLDNSSIANPYASPNRTIDYTLTVKSTLGCEGKATVNVTVYQPIYIPTAFTPNADSMNDYWELAGMEAYPNAEVQVFNRWGNVVFYAKGTYNLAPFDGYDKNKLLPEGMYVYKINPFPDRPDFQYKGTFMLLR
jgi:gliding motility-associated-like protein